MDWNNFVQSILPALVSCVVSILGCVVSLAKSGTQSIVNRLNKTDGAISRSAVSDPKHYYSSFDTSDLSDYVVVIEGREIPLSSLVVKRKVN